MHSLHVLNLYSSSQARVAVFCLFICIPSCSYSICTLCQACTSYSSSYGFCILSLQHLCSPFVSPASLFTLFISSICILPLCLQHLYSPTLSPASVFSPGARLSKGQPSGPDSGEDRQELCQGLSEIRGTEWLKKGYGLGGLGGVAAWVRGGAKGAPLLSIAPLSTYHCYRGFRHHFFYCGKW
ncbi:hypothetical protein XENTR_v10014936 [Xenopus tropicalis]|nr:hypothetical protein XENTR_v10014936 [Xenopus tropicalis]